MLGMTGQWFERVSGSLRWCRVTEVGEPYRAVWIRIRTWIPGTLAGAPLM